MAEVTSDHDTIRKWAEAKGGEPTAVERTHEGVDVGIIRIMFPKAPHSEHDSLVEVSWDEISRNSRSVSSRSCTKGAVEFNKIVGRNREKRAHGEHDAARHRPNSSSSGMRPTTFWAQRSSAARRACASSSEGERQAEAPGPAARPPPDPGALLQPAGARPATASPLEARLGLATRLADELNEVDFGDWSGQDLSDLDALAEWRQFNSFRSCARAPGGECMGDVLSRVLDLVERLCSEHDDRMVALISHGDVVEYRDRPLPWRPSGSVSADRDEPGVVQTSYEIRPYGPEVLLVNGVGDAAAGGLSLLSRPGSPMTALQSANRRPEVGECGCSGPGGSARGRGARAPAARRDRRRRIGGLAAAATGPGAGRRHGHRPAQLPALFQPLLCRVATSRTLACRHRAADPGDAPALSRHRGRHRQGHDGRPGRAPGRRARERRPKLRHLILATGSASARP